MEAKNTIYNTHSSGRTHDGREEGRRRYERHGQDSRKVCVRRRGSASELVHITHVLSSGDALSSVAAVRRAQLLPPQHSESNKPIDKEASR